jgi:hypothetical protein
VCRIGETSRHQVSLLFIRHFEHGKKSLDDSIEVVHVGSIDTCSVCARCVCRHGTVQTSLGIFHTVVLMLIDELVSTMI